MAKTTTTRSDLEAALRTVGVQQGDTLLAHSSLSSLGYLEGGPDAVIDTLLGAVGRRGLLIMPTFADSIAIPTRKIEPVPYDPASSPCKRRVGAIPDTFRQRPGVYRSLHPTHSVAAFGPGAEELVKGGERRALDPAGPFGKFVRMNGKVLFLGAKLGSNTTIHCAEDWMGCPFLTEQRAQVKTPDGHKEVIITGHPTGCRAFYGQGGAPTERMMNEGIATTVYLGDARLVLMFARDIIRVCCEGEEDMPGFVLCRGTPHDFCRAGMAGCVRERDSILERIAALRENGWSPGAE